MALGPIFSTILRPIVGRKDDNDGIDFFYPLTLFFALGVYLVFDRYQQARNKPLPFIWAVPKEASPTYTGYSIKNPTLESHKSDSILSPHGYTGNRKFITSFDPATGLHLGTVIADDEDEIQEKIAKAAHAQTKWAKTTFSQRRRVVRSLLKWLTDNQEGCAQVACRDTGKTMVDAALGEILTTCSKAEWLLKHGERVLTPENRSTNFMLSYKSSKVYYEPLGVVAAVVSWNYPLHNAWSPILASIFAGNAVVLKCSEHVIWSSHWFIGAIKTCLEVCGHDLELVQMVCCLPPEANALIESPVIKHITFIGSETVGRIIAKAALTNLTPVTLELGGKDPAVILPGTDINKWASVWMRGVYQNAGQNCIGIERLIVHTDQYDELKDIFEERVKKLRLGSVLTEQPGSYIQPVDTGAMISPVQFSKLERLIAAAEDDGAHLLVGGKRFNHVYMENGFYFEPTVLGDVTENMEIANAELFAPIALIMRYETIEEAIAMANNTRYGLGASVFGPDQRECVDVAKKLVCGMVSINDFGVFYLNQDLPFGGTKMSGYGRFGGPEGLRSLTNPKAIIVDRWPNLIQTSIPTILDYPIGSLVHSWDFVRGLINFFYAYDWRDQARGLLAMLTAKS